MQSIAGKNMGRVQGFTLVEMLIVVAMIGILAAIAVPAYRDFMVRSKLPDAFQALSGARVKMEQYYQDNRTYMQSGACPSTSVFGAAADVSKYFNVAFVPGSCTRVAYQIQATGKTTEVINDFVYTIDQAGVKTTSTLGANWTGVTGTHGIRCSHGGDTGNDSSGWIAKRDLTCYQ